MEKLPFSQLGLSAELLKAVDRMGFEEASPIQTAVIPLLLGGRDVIGQSATGSGKTAAFAIPAIEKVDPKLRAVQVLILCPTRELALQVAEEVSKLAIFKKGVIEVPIFGGQSYERQFRGLAAGAQVVIGTPGRVMDHMQRGTLKLDNLRMVVLDECDRMLDMGFRDDIEHILSATPTGRQLLFFSATMPPAIRALIQRFTANPEWVKIDAHAKNAPKVEQVYFEVDRRSKVEVLTRLIDIHDFRYGIIFCSTKLMVDELDDQLHARGYQTDRLHGDIPQAARTRVMDKFRRRGFEFLVATDVAARGLDVDDLEVVFNFDLPNDVEDYTHRIGRTGRAGKTGMAFTFVAGRELWKLQSMVRYGKLKIRRENVPSLDKVEEARENVFFERLRNTLESKIFKPQDRIVDRLLEQGFPSTDVISALIHILQGGAEPKADGRESNDPKGVSPAGLTPAPSAPKRSEPASPSPEASAPAHVPFHAKVSAPRAEKPAPKAHTPRPTPEPETAESTASEPDSEPAAETHEPAPAPAPRPVQDLLPKKVQSAWYARVSPEDAATARSGDAYTEARPSKRKFERGMRTGREPGMVTLRFSIGRAQGATPALLVGKIAGVTRLPASVVGAIDLGESNSLVDVAADHASVILKKLHGVRISGVPLSVSAQQPSD